MHNKNQFNAKYFVFLKSNREKNIITKKIASVQIKFTKHDNY